MKNLPTIKWHCNSDDDFVGRCSGWMLRVEKMSENNCWWCIYFPDDRIESRIDDFDECIARTINEAIDYATSAFYFHWSESPEKVEYDAIEIQPVDSPIYDGWRYQMIAIIPLENSSKVTRQKFGKLYPTRSAASRKAHKLSKKVSHWYLI